VHAVQISRRNASCGHRPQTSTKGPPSVDSIASYWLAMAIQEA
jgi:hypothetical protein